MKKLTYIILTLCIFLCIHGCNANTNDRTPTDSSSETAEDLKLDTEMVESSENHEEPTTRGVAFPYQIVYGDINAISLAKFFRHGNHMIVVSYENDTEIITEYGNHPRYEKVYTFGPDGSLLKEAIMEEKGMQYADVDKDGNIWTIATIVTMDEETGEYSIYNSIVNCFDNDGKLLGKVELGDIGFIIGEPWAHFLVGDDGNFYYLREPECGNSIYVFGSDGSLLCEIEAISGWNTKRLTKLPGGGMAALMGGDGKFDVLREINLETGEFEKEWMINLQARFMYVCRDESGEYDLLISNEIGAYGYSLEEERYTELINWEERGLIKNMFLYQMFQYVALYPEQYVYSFLRDNQFHPPFDNTTFTLIRLGLSDEEQTSEQSGLASGHTTNTNNAAGTNNATDTDKKTVTLSALRLSNELKVAVATFNRRNPEYHVDIMEYMGQGFSEEDAINNFTMDIISGNVPDILILDNDMEIAGLIDKGVFADLYEFMDNDPDISREDYLPNTFQALETDGKLYTGITSFSISTLLGKTSDVGSDMGWTWDEYRSLMARKSEGTLPFDDFHTRFSKNDAIRCMAITKIGDYVDFNTGICSFDNEDFIEFLKTVDIYPQEAGGRVPVSAFREGDTLMMNVFVSNFNIIKVLETAYFGEPTTFIGFPSDRGGNGSSAIIKNRFAIAERAKEFDGAWEFARFLLTDFQEVAAKEGFPIRKSDLDRLAMEAMKNGSQEINLTDEGFSYTVHIENNTREDNQKVYDLILGTIDFLGQNERIVQIIREEASYYFTGQKTAEDIAAVIQNRISLYLAENR